MRSPVEPGSTVIAHVGGATVRGTVAGVSRTQIFLELASIAQGPDTPVAVDGYYLVPRSTPMQVIPDGARSARGQA